MLEEIANSPEPAAFTGSVPANYVTFLQKARDCLSGEAADNQGIHTLFQHIRNPNTYFTILTQRARGTFLTVPQLTQIINDDKGLFFDAEGKVREQFLDTMKSVLLYLQSRFTETSAAVGGRLDTNIVSKAKANEILGVLEAAPDADAALSDENLEKLNNNLKFLVGPWYNLNYGDPAFEFTDSPAPRGGRRTRRSSLKRRSGKKKNTRRRK